MIYLPLLSTDIKILFIEISYETSVLRSCFKKPQFPSLERPSASCSAESSICNSFSKKNSFFKLWANKIDLDIRAEIIDKKMEIALFNMIFINVFNLFYCTLRRNYQKDAIPGRSHITLKHSILNTISDSWMLPSSRSA